MHTLTCTGKHAYTQKQKKREWMRVCVCLRGWGRGDVGPVTSKVLGHSPPPPPLLPSSPLPPPPAPRPLPPQECVWRWWCHFISPLSRSLLLYGDRAEEGWGEVGGRELDLLHPSSLYDNNIRVSRPTKSVTTAPQRSPSPRHVIKQPAG